jgi:hypothetical protein
VANIEHYAGELFSHIGRIVTNVQLANRASSGFATILGSREERIKVAGSRNGNFTGVACRSTTATDSGDQGWGSQFFGATRACAI